MRYDLKVGDRVSAARDHLDGNHVILKGYTGRILLFDRSTDRFGVEWDEDVYGHSLDGRCESGHGWWVDTCDVLPAIFIDSDDREIEPFDQNEFEMFLGGYHIEAV